MSGKGEPEPSQEQNVPQHPASPLKFKISDQPPDGTKGDFENTIRLDPENLEELRTVLHEYLHECGWRVQVREVIQEALNARTLGQTNYAEIAKEVTPKAHELLPPDLAKAVEDRVRELLDGSSSEEEEEEEAEQKADGGDKKET